jgi:hypothetical protein
MTQDKGHMTGHRTRELDRISNGGIKRGTRMTLIWRIKKDKKNYII